MSGFFTKYFGDPDVLLAYSSTKVIRIRDRWLGLLYWFLMSCIFAYIVLYQLLWQQSYLAKEGITGTLSALVVGTNRTKSINLGNLSYCTQKACQLWDQHDVRYPNQNAMQLMITTYVEEQQQYRRCPLDAQTCPYDSPFATVGSTKEYYVGGIETYGLELSHSAEAALFYAETGKSKFTAANFEVHGELLDGLAEHKQHAIKEFPRSDQVHPTIETASDFLTIEELLRAANISSLDEHLEGNTRPIRETGVVIFFRVQYFNTHTFFAPSAHFTYTYTVSKQDTESRIYVPEYREEYGANRTLYVRNGISLVFIQQGEVGMFSFSTLLLSLDLVAIYALPLRSIYRKQKYEQSVKFGEVRENQELRELLENYSEDFQVQQLLADLQSESVENGAPLL
eukprot:gene11106-13124_t